LRDPAEIRQCLDLLEQEVRRLNGLVDRLIQLSRLEAKQHQFHRDPLRVDDVLQDALAAFDAATLSDKAAVEVVSPADLRIRGDRDALAQAIANLLVNAWKYTPSTGRRITLRAAADRHHVDIVVADNGPGIPPEERSRIFDHFERGRGAVDGARAGSGRGLAIVRAIARGHHGRVDLTATVGAGSEFRLRLPRDRRAA
jgi:signal transduction histidine kinase